MTTPEQLARLQARAIENPMEEPAFFQALLTAVLYVHLPLSDDSGKVRLICFTRPDGITVIPVFSDDVKAHAAARGAARVVAVVGRELFESAPGATWMLDPNDVSCTLYPEEIVPRSAVAACRSFSGTTLAIRLSSEQPDQKMRGSARPLYAPPCRSRRSARYIYLRWRARSRNARPACSSSSR
jgi:hypothetical protein